MKTKQEQSSFELIYQEKKKEKQSYSVIKKCLHAENFPRNVYMHCEKKISGRTLNTKSTERALYAWTSGLKQLLHEAGYSLTIQLKRYFHSKKLHKISILTAQDLHCYYHF